MMNFVVRTLKKNVVRQLTIVLLGLLSCLTVPSNAEDHSNGDAEIESNVLPSGDFPMPFQLRFAEKPLQITAKVVDAEGEPIRAASISVFADPPDFSVPHLRRLLLGTVRVNEQGTGSAAFRCPPHYQVDRVWAVAGADGYGSDIVSVALRHDEQNLQFRLPHARSVNGTLVTPDGQPAKNVETHVERFADADGDIAGLNSETPGWPASVTTDDSGNFSLSSIPVRESRQFLRLRIDDDRFAPESWSHSLLPDNVDDIQLKATDPFFVNGKVVAQDSGKPLLDTWLQVVTLDHRQIGDLQYDAVQGRVDSSGEFKIRCQPGKRIVAYVYPPSDTLYPAWTVSTAGQQDDETSREIDIRVPRGRLLKGRVTDTTTNEPVAGARTVYWLRKGRRADNIHLPRNRVQMTYWASEYRSVLSNENGEFTIPVLPARGYLLTKAPTLEFVSQQISYDQAQEGRPGAYFYNVEAFTPIDFADVDSSDPLPAVTIELNRGKSVTLKVSDPDGNAVDGAVLLDPHYTKNRSRYDSSSRQIPVINGQASVSGCDPDAVRTVHVVDVRRQLGTTVELDRGEIEAGELKVTLEPCGSARVKLLDEDGEPVRARAIYGSGMVLRADLIAGESADRPEISVNNTQRFIKWSMSSLDRERHRSLKTNAEGVVTFPTLIPGARYRLICLQPGYTESNTFVVKAGEINEFSMVLPNVR